MNIAILGASFAGLSSYLFLRKRLGKDVNITLYDQESYFTYIPALHECLGNSKYLSKIQFDLKKYYGDDFHQAKVTKVDHECLVTDDGKTHCYDYLIIATGSRTNFFGNTSFETYAQPVRTAQDILDINSKLPTCKHITVIGGGYTGVEVAASIAESYPEKEIRIVHSRERLLDPYSEKVSNRTHSRLEKKGVDIICKQKVTSLTEDSVVLSDGSELASDLHLFCTGVKINDETHAPQLSFESEYRSLESDRVYLCGDVALHGLRTTAHNAMIEGRRIGHIVADHISDTNTSYPPLENREILALALGHHDGIITNGDTGIYFPRIIGWCKRIVERRVMFEFTKKIMLWV